MSLATTIDNLGSIAEVLFRDGLAQLYLLLLEFLEVLVDLIILLKLLNDLARLRIERLIAKQVIVSLGDALYPARAADVLGHARHTLHIRSELLQLLARSRRSGWRRSHLRHRRCYLL